MKTVLLTLISISTFLSSCELNVVDNGNKQEDDIDLKNANQVIEASNEFGFELFNDLLSLENDSTNVFISPTSISLALAMTKNGAAGNTKTGMAKAMGMEHLNDAQINETYRDLMAGLTTIEEKVLLEIANSIWYREGFTVEPDFFNINNNYYNAEVEDLDFDDPTSKDIINTWVSDKTHEKIPSILDKIYPNEIMFLINAIYFKGEWAIDFNKENTNEQYFTTATDTLVEVDMMHMKEVIGYYENDDFQACELDYGQGNFSMVVLLPKQDKSLGDVTSNMNNNNWDDWMVAMDTQCVDLSLPKFTFEYGVKDELKKVLVNRGMADAFSPDFADFAGINKDEDLYISYIKHKTFVEVNEEGTEAAAATIVAVAIRTVAIQEPDPNPVMIVNRPFIFVIREKTSKTNVFIGRVSNPLSE